MTELLTAAQMRAIEQAAIESGEVTGLELMERAGQGVVDAIMEWRPELATAPHRAVVLCGPGNNGGDGFVVARLLKQRGWEVEVFQYGDEAKLPPDAAENARRWRRIGLTTPISVDETAEEFEARFEALSATDIVADAVFGTGLKRCFVPPQSVNLFFHRRMTDSFWFDGVPFPPYIVALDNASEMDIDSGEVLEDLDAQCGGESGAHLTLTFHRPKVGHFLAEGPMRSGELKVIDIGLEKDAVLGDVPSLDRGVEFVRQTINPAHDLFTKSLLSRRSLTTKQKYSHGHAFMLSGGPGMGGAARLAARGSLRIGAGLVTVGCPTDALTENAARLDAIMLTAVNSVDDVLTQVRRRKINAICVGPGFGSGALLRRFVAQILGAQIPTVLDADALTEYRDGPETLFGMLHENCVLTPHEGEFGRLFPDILARLNELPTRGPAYSKVDATRAAAARAGCVVLFKGPDTVIANPLGQCVINSAHYDRAAPWLATAGSGDVLAGFITGLLARGFAPMQAAETAAWLHVECALKFGPGLIAEDIPEQLPAVFRELGF